MNFDERLKAAIGEPKRNTGTKPRSLLRMYVAANFADIEAASRAGYSYAQLAEFVEKETGETVSIRRLRSMMYVVRRSFNPPSRGKGVSYTFAGEDKIHKIFVPDGSLVDNTLERIKADTGKSVFITSEKSMIERGYKKWKP